MNPREVAIWLNKECTDEEYIETFALLYKAMDNRGIPEEYDKEFMISNLNVKGLCGKLESMLNVLKKKIK